MGPAHPERRQAEVTNREPRCADGVGIVPSILGEGHSLPVLYPVNLDRKRPLRGWGLLRKSRGKVWRGENGVGKSAWIRSRVGSSRRLCVLDGDSRRSIQRVSHHPGSLPEAAGEVTPVAEIGLHADLPLLFQPLCHGSFRGRKPLQDAWGRPFGLHGQLLYCGVRRECLFERLPITARGYALRLPPPIGPKPAHGARSGWPPQWTRWSPSCGTRPHATGRRIGLASGNRSRRRGRTAPAERPGKPSRCASNDRGPCGGRPLLRRTGVHQTCSLGLALRIWATIHPIPPTPERKASRNIAMGPPWTSTGSSHTLKSLLISRFCTI